MSDTPRLDFLLKRLTLLAGDVRDHLAAGDWEQAAPLQEQYDESFAALTRLVETGHAFTATHTNELARLRHVHEENLRLTSELLASAGRELSNIRRMRVMGRSYSPLGANHRPSPRYIDGSA